MGERTAEDLEVVFVDANGSFESFYRREYRRLVSLGRGALHQRRVGAENVVIAGQAAQRYS